MKTTVFTLRTSGAQKLKLAFVLGLLGTLTAMAWICYVPKELPCPAVVGLCALIDDTDVRYSPKTASAGSLTVTYHPTEHDCYYMCAGHTDPVGYYPTIVFAGTCPPP